MYVDFEEASKRYTKIEIYFKKVAVTFEKNFTFLKIWSFPKYFAHIFFVYGYVCKKTISPCIGRSHYCFDEISGYLD